MPERFKTLEFQIVADPEKGDWVNLGLQRMLLDTWLRENPLSDLEIFHNLPSNQGGTRTGFLWYPVHVKTQPGQPDPKPEYLLIRLEREKNYVFRGTDLQKVQKSTNPVRGPVIHFEMKDVRKKDFEEFTRRNLHRSLAIILDGKVRGQSVIQAPIPGIWVLDVDLR